MTAELLPTTPLGIDDVTSVEDGRSLIDAIDDELLDLLARRREVSGRIQQLRIEAGGSRVEHSRENAILRRYTEGLGEGGVELALAVLQHCRGRRTGPRL